MAPAVAVIVSVRLINVEPAENVIVALPVLSVVADEELNCPPDEEKVTG